VIETAGRITVPPTRRPAPVRPHAAPAVRLVGRHTELAAISAALERALAGESQLVEVTGDPGIGKTALLAAAGSVARRQSVAVVPASAAHGGALAAALAGRLAAFGVNERRAHAKALAGFGMPTTSDEPTERRLGPERALLRLLSAPDGLVVLLDDLHRGTDRTVELISDLLSRPMRARLLLVYAYRDRQAGPALRGAAQGRGTVTRLPLGPLTEADCARLAGTLPRSQLRALYRDSQGVPLYLRAYRDGRTEQAVPLTELDPLSPAARRALCAAAVLGGDLEPGIVAAVAELPEPARYTVFDELCRHDLVRPIPGTGRFGFRHPLLAEAVYQATEPGWRLAAHATAARILADRHAAAHVLAPHVVRIAVPGTTGSVTDAVAILVDGAATVRDRSPHLAIQWLHTARDLLPEHPDTLDDRADLLLELALALGAAGRTGEARETMHTAIPLLRPRMAARRLRAVTFCSQLERLLGHRGECLALLRRELDETSPDSIAYRAALMTELAGTELVGGHLTAARTWADQALTAARCGGVRHVEATGHGALAMAHCLDANPAAAQAELARATPLLDGLLDSELAIQPEAAIWTGWAELILGRPWDALRHLDRALATGRTAAHQLGVAYLLIARVVVLAAVGRFADANAAAEDLAELAALTGTGMLRTIAGAAGAWIGVWTGDNPAAAYGLAGDDPGGLAALGWFGAVAQGMRAEALLDAGDPGGCAELLAHHSFTDAWSQVRRWELLTRAALAQGQTELARERAAMATSCAGRLPLPGLTGVARLAAAQVQAVSDPTAAAVTADQAVEELTAGGSLTDARRAQVVAAAARAACGQVETARAQLAEVQAALEHGGAPRLARRTARLKLSTGSPGRLRGKPETLTVRERQVAHLVAEGASNREIARRLDVKEKTVEMHLSRVFVKLGVANRVGVAREFALSPRQD
jgi:DNA-binding NarL/FixJ family response regulator